jgi:dTDP-4-dehydrorhamnose 3,5-epimerase
MEVQETALPGVVVLTPKRFSDARGFFSESWNKRTVAGVGIELDFVQDNHSLSVEAGTLRGLHFQAPPHAQDKLVRCGRGRLLDVIVDIRKGSPTFGKWISVELSAENGRQILVPKGFLHGFLTREPNTEICYKCSEFFSPDCDGVVRWDSCGVDWNLDGDPILSDKDTNAPTMDSFESPFVWEGAV